MKIFFAVLAVIFMFGMIGDKEPENRQNFTTGFMVTILGIVALYALEWMVLIV